MFLLCVLFCQLHPCFGSPELNLCGWHIYSLNVISRMSVAFSANKTLLETYCSFLYINSRYCWRNLAQTSGNHFVRATRRINRPVLSSRSFVIMYSHCSNYLPVLFLLVASPSKLLSALSLRFQDKHKPCLHVI